MTRTKECPEAATSGATQRVNSHLNNIREDLLNAMADAGVTPANSAEIVMDGRLHRYRVDGDKSGRLNGWYVAHTDGRPAGCVGSWKTGVTRTWKADGYAPLTAAERQQIEQAQSERDAKRKREAWAAKAKAEQIVADSNEPDAAHPYLLTKGIDPHLARQWRNVLVLPIMGFDYELWSVQFISTNGDKRLLTGGRKAGNFILVDGDARGASRVLICEGYATGCTLAESEPEALVLAAIDAGNLRSVATGARNQWPQSQIVVCGDADETGRHKAAQAARAANALLAVPEFPTGVNGSDFNDLAQGGV